MKPACSPYAAREHHGDTVTHLATCPCGWLRAAPDETTARQYAKKHEPRPAKEE